MIDNIITWMISWAVLYEMFKKCSAEMQKQKKLKKVKDFGRKKIFKVTFLLKKNLYLFTLLVISQQL